MKKIILVATLLTFLIGACNTKSKEAAEKSAYQQATETLAEKEKKNPTSFLTVSNHDKHNLLGQTVIKGAVSNNAKICSYKDVELELSFFSKTGALLEKDIETVYDVVEPGKTTAFKTKYFSPRGTDSVGIKVLGAKIN